MKKTILLFTCITLLVLAGCGPAPTPIPTNTPAPTRTPGPGLWIINKSTGLYEELNIDSKLTADLPEGTQLIPEDGESIVPLCSSFIDSGTTYNLCKMKVVKTGKTGWVLKKWMELKK